MHLAQELCRSTLGYRSQVVDQVFVRHSYPCVSDVEHPAFLVSLKQTTSSVTMQRVLLIQNFDRQSLDRQNLLPIPIIGIFSIFLQIW